MIRKIANKISKRYVLISLILVGLIGLFMIFVFMGYFLDMANGYPYMETKLGFLPDDLFEMAEGYVTGIALDENDEIIGYQFVSLGKFTDFVKAGDTPNEAWEKAKGQYGRVADAVKIIDPRKE